MKRLLSDPAISTVNPGYFERWDLLLYAQDQQVLLERNIDVQHHGVFGNSDGSLFQSAIRCLLELGANGLTSTGQTLSLSAVFLGQN